MLSEDIDDYNAFDYADQEVELFINKHSKNHESIDDATTDELIEDLEEAIG